jgi:phosphoribosyl 1,2-cyclic phosphodiesterase
VRADCPLPGVEAGKLVAESLNVRIAVLASGSSGNAILISSDSTSVLVDAGVSARRLMRGAQQACVPPTSIDAVLVTHEHSDHVAGLSTLTKRLGLPVVASPGTHAAIRPRIEGASERVEVEAGREYEIGALSITPFATSHDCEEPLGFSIGDGSSRTVIATDLGIVGRNVRRHLLEADCAVLEFNHDERMLLEGTYPWYLKQRILSNVGHLSNAAAADELVRAGDAPLSLLILAHLSRENNSAELARAAARGALERAGRSDVRVLVAHRSETLGPIAIGGDRAGESDELREGMGLPCTR